MIMASADDESQGLLLKDESQGLLLKEVNALDPEDPAPDETTQSRPWLQSLKGILAGFVCVLCHIVGITNLQLLERRVPDLELQAFRCGGIVITCSIGMLIKQRSPMVPSSETPHLVLYICLAILASISMYVGYAFVPASMGQCTQNTSELLSGLLIFWLCGQEKYSIKKIFAVFLCVVGVILTAQPWHEASQKPIVEKPDMEMSPLKNHSEDCMLQMGKLCADKRKILSKDRPVSCRNHTHLGTNDRSNPCESLLAKFTKKNKTYFDCIGWLSCWSKLVAAEYQIGELSNGKNKTNEKKIKLFLLTIPEEQGILTGIIILGVGGTIHSVITSVFKKYPGIGENIFRSLFWSFVFGVTSSLVLTFTLESPVWPKGGFDTVAVFVHSLASAGNFVFWGYSLQYISGTTFNITYGTSVVFFLIPQYTVLASILPGQKNWMEVLGVFIVLCGSGLASVTEVFQNLGKPEPAGEQG